MQISRLGEFGLIERFRKGIKAGPSVVKGPGDDCAVLKYGGKNYQLLTCDMLVEGVDFTRKDDPYLVGRKAIAASLSDIASCAGLPRHCLVSLGLPRNTSVNLVDRLFKGMRDTAARFGVNIIGGDVSRARQIIIDVSMSGIVEKKNLALRSGAKKADIIFVSGTLGGSISGRHLKVTPRLKEARRLVKSFRVNSMIDISDGLIQDLGHILEASNAGALIYEELIPLSRSAKNVSDALYSGEDFELLFTLPLKEARRLVAKKSGIFKPVGEIVGKKSGIKLIDKKGREKPLKIKGFCHF